MLPIVPIVPVSLRENGPWGLTWSGLFYIDDLLSYYFSFTTALQAHWLPCYFLNAKHTHLQHLRNSSTLSRMLSPDIHVIIFFRSLLKPYHPSKVLFATHPTKIQTTPSPHTPSLFPVLFFSSDALFIQYTILLIYLICYQSWCTRMKDEGRV